MKPDKRPLPEGTIGCVAGHRGPPRCPESQSDISTNLCKVRQIRQYENLMDIIY